MRMREPHPDFRYRQQMENPLMQSSAGEAVALERVRPADLCGPAPAGASTRQPRLLLVDDDSFLLGIQARILRDLGYPQVATAGSAEAALLMLQRQPNAFDIIVCDLNMPGMDGIQFLRILDARNFCCSVILLSGEDARIMHTVQKLFEGRGLLVIGALAKPATQAGLRAMIETWQLPETLAQPRSDPAPRVTAGELQAATRQAQWVLHYQPKVDLRTGQLAGMEALVRWNHPLHGLLYPEFFIPLAEECGAIDALTEWVLHDAMRQLSAWRTRGLKFKMAVNVSMDDLAEPDFAQRVGALLQDACVSPQDVTLEVTESRLAAPGSTPLENLVRLRMQRFGLSIDDFGTGHSSLAQLRDVPFTELKVDSSFVKGARHSPSNRPILEGSIGIAKRLGMQSVAEGVENEDDWHLLREIGCDLAQGYFIGAPMAPADFPGWLESWMRKSAALGLE
jgi:EAL domain-containing protein (putative c-di-GMP-specific phosphodiesterase class I)/ActR/RegA family two-component response regulator